MQLPYAIRETLVEDIDEFVEGFSSDPDAEQVATYVIETLETIAEDEGIDEVITSLEEDAELDVSLHELLETEMSSNDEFRYTGEEIVSLLERICQIEWEDSDGSDDEDDEEEDEDEADDRDADED